MNELILGVFVGLGAFVAYRIYLEMSSDEILSRLKLKSAEKRKSEYEKKDQELSEEVAREQAAYDNAKRLDDSRKPCKG